MKSGDKLGKFIDLTGQKFGILTVLERALNKGKRTTWRCVCECGTVKDIIGNLEILKIFYYPNLK